MCGGYSRVSMRTFIRGLSTSRGGEERAPVRARELPVAPHEGDRVLTLLGVEHGERDGHDGAPSRRRAASHALRPGDADAPGRVAEEALDLVPRPSPVDD